MVGEDAAAEFEEMGEATSAVARGWAGVGTGRELTEAAGAVRGWSEAWGWGEAWAAGLRDGGGVWVGVEAGVGVTGGVGIGVGIGSGGETVGAPWGGRVDPVRSKSAVAKPVKTLSG